MTELEPVHVLLRRLSVEREPCACGGFVEAVSRQPTHVWIGVRRHNVSPEHQAWRARRKAER